MNTDRINFYTCKECHQTESVWNHITTDHKEEEQLEDRRNVGENSCNSGDETDERVQSLMFMLMISANPDGSPSQFIRISGVPCICLYEKKRKRTTALKTADRSFPNSESNYYVTWDKCVNYVGRNVTAQKDS